MVGAGRKGRWRAARGEKSCVGRKDWEKECDGRIPSDIGSKKPILKAFLGFFSVRSSSTGNNEQHCFRQLFALLFRGI